MKTQVHRKSIKLKYFDESFAVNKNMTYPYIRLDWWPAVGSDGPSSWGYDLLWIWRMASSGRTPDKRTGPAGPWIFPEKKNYIINFNSEIVLSFSIFKSFSGVYLARVLAILKSWLLAELSQNPKYTHPCLCNWLLNLKILSKFLPMRPKLSNWLQLWRVNLPYDKI